MDVNEHERLSNITRRQTHIKVKEHIVVRKHMDVFENERLFYFTPGHKLK